MGLTEKKPSTVPMIQLNSSSLINTISIWTCCLLPLLFLVAISDLSASLMLTVVLVVNSVIGLVTALLLFSPSSRSVSCSLNTITYRRYGLPLALCLGLPLFFAGCFFAGVRAVSLLMMLPLQAVILRDMLRFSLTSSRLSVVRRSFAILLWSFSASLLMGMSMLILLALIHF